MNVVDLGNNNAILGHFKDWNKPGKQQVFIDLITAGCSLTAKSGQGYAPLHMAVACKSPNLIDCLMDHGADVEELTSEKNIGIVLIDTGLAI